MSQVTVYEVAARARVSISTVSRVLNTPEKVTPPTRARVMAAIDELGFIPKAEAVARSRRDHGRIGVLAPFPTYPSFVQRLAGVAAALAGSPYELTIYYVDSCARLEGYLSSLTVTRRLDGLIVMALPFSQAAAQRLIKAELQTVLVEFAFEGFSSIEIDDEAGGRLAGEHLAARGHRRCAFVGDTDLPDYAIHTSDRRLAGYRAALARAGMALPASHIALVPHGLEPALQGTQGLLALSERPTAIFAASDTQALGALKAARACSLRVPHDLAVIGFDDLEIADYIGLTTIHQPLEESGRVAVELLLGRLADSTRTPQRVQLPLTLVERETA